MPKPDTKWNVLPHGPIQQLADNLWWVLGSLPNMSLKRAMTIVRRSDGSLLLHSAIALDEPAMRELEALGPPSVMLVPSAIHRLDAPRYKARYPALKVYGPKRGRHEIGEVVALDGTFEDYPRDAAVQIEPLPGVGGKEAVVLVRSPDGLSVVLNDAVMNMDRKRDLLGFLFTTAMGSAPGPRVSRLAKLLLVEDRAAFRSELERLAALPELVRLIVSHEKVASGSDASAALRRAASFL